MFKDVYLVVKKHQIYESHTVLTGLGRISDKRFTREQNNNVNKLVRSINSSRVIKKAKRSSKNVLVKCDILGHVLLFPSNAVDPSECEANDFFYLSEDVYLCQKN